MKKHLIVIGIISILIICGFNGCVERSTTNKTNDDKNGKTSADRIELVGWNLVPAEYNNGKISTFGGETGEQIRFEHQGRSDLYFISGGVKNNNGYVTDVKVIITFYNENDVIIDSTCTIVQNIEENEIKPFNRQINGMDIPMKGMYNTEYFDEIKDVRLSIIEIMVKEELFTLSRNDENSDGINDYFYMEDFSSDDIIIKEFEWEYRSKLYSVKVEIPKVKYDTIKHKNNGNYLFSIDDVIIKLSISEFAQAFLEKDQHIGSIAEQISNQMEKYNHKSVADVIYEFIKLFEYVDDKTISDNGYPKHPIETLIEEKGDCEDTVFLSYAIIRNCNINCAFLDYIGHIALGIHSYYDSIDEDEYYYKIDYEGSTRYYRYFESTVMLGFTREIGDIPEKYLSESPKLIVPYLKVEEIVNAIQKQK